MDARKLEALALMLAEERLARQTAERTAAELDTRLGEMAKLDAEMVGIASYAAIKRLTEERNAACAEAARLAQELSVARLATQDADERAQARERERDDAIEECGALQEEVNLLRRERAARIENDPHRYDQSMGPSYGEGDKT